MTPEHVAAVVFGTSATWWFVRAFVYLGIGSALWQLRPVPRSRRPVLTSNGPQPRYALRFCVAIGAAALLVISSAYGWRTASGRHFTAVQASTAWDAKASEPPYLGVFEPGEQGSYQVVRQFGNLAGRQPQVVLSYAPWGRPFDQRFADTVRAHQAIPFVQLLPLHVTMASIAGGKSDAFLRSFAARVRGFGSQVIISFAPEMNGSWYAWGYGHTPPSGYVAAWRHIVSFFRSAGASNVTWLWTVNTERAKGPAISQWWPGDSYVSWVGIDGYYYYPADTFGIVFARTITAIRKLTAKPVLLSETAVGPNPRQAAQVQGIFQGVRSNHLIGMVWFDMKQNDPPYRQDWRLEDSPVGSAAFRQGVRSLP